MGVRSLPVLLLVGVGLCAEAGVIGGLGHAAAACPAGDRAAARAATDSGRQRWTLRTPEDLRAALAAFERAIAADPCYAPAWAGRAEALALLYDYVGARDAARRALNLDDSLAAAHSALGFALLHGEWDWEAAGRHLERAVELDPRYVTAHSWHAIWLETSGRHEEALAAARRAAALEPDSPHAQAAIGYRLFWARHYAAAAQHLAALVATAPGLAGARYFLGRALVEQGRLAEAEQVFAAARAMAPQDPNLGSALAYLHARAGRRREALAALRDLEAQARRGLPFASQTAGLYAALGQKEAALDWLERAAAAREGPLVWLRIDPRFDELRGHPRFQRLLRLQSASPWRGATE